MSDDKNIVDSAERMNADQQETQRRRIEARNTTVRVVGVAGAIAYAVSCLFSSLVSCQTDNNARALQDEANYQHSFAECEQRQGAGNCWRMQYVRCLDTSKSTSYCESLNPAYVPDTSWF